MYRGYVRLLKLYLIYLNEIDKCEYYNLDTYVFTRMIFISMN